MMRNGGFDIPHDVQQIQEILPPTEKAHNVDEIIFSEVCCHSRRCIARFAKFYIYVFKIVSVLWFSFTLKLVHIISKETFITHQNPLMHIGWILAFFDIVTLYKLKSAVYSTNRERRDTSPSSLYKIAASYRIFWLAYLASLGYEVSGNEKIHEYYLFEMIGGLLLFVMHIHASIIFWDSATIIIINRRRRRM